MYQKTNKNEKVFVLLSIQALVISKIAGYNFEKAKRSHPFTCRTINKN